MKLLSVNCGLPREVAWRGSTVLTSIYKNPVEGRVALRTVNLDGDRQSDLTVHGGKDKAVYCYPIEHYSYWQTELPGTGLSYGAFGENFTVEGLHEDTVHIGDRLSVGSAELIVTQPRMPCYKLGIRFGSDDMVRRFLEADARVSTSPSCARAKSVLATSSPSSSTTLNQFRFPKSPASTSPRNTLLTMYARPVAP